jgi:uncharacterized damage-inducible protein DinB
MISPAQLSEAFARNTSLILRQTEGLSQADSLIQPPSHGNCLNWVLGHVVQYRDNAFDLLGAPRVMGEAGERYKRESDPVTGEGPGVLPLEALLEILAHSQDALQRALEDATETYLEQEAPTQRGMTTRGARLFFYYFHETYHVGQTELLRQLAGRDDKII